MPQNTMQWIGFARIVILLCGAAMAASAHWEAVGVAVAAIGLVELIRGSYLDETAPPATPSSKRK